MLANALVPRIGLSNGLPSDKWWGRRSINVTRNRGRDYSRSYAASSARPRGGARYFTNPASYLHSSRSGSRHPRMMYTRPQLHNFMDNYDSPGYRRGLGYRSSGYPYHDPYSMSGYGHRSGSGSGGSGYFGSYHSPLGHYRRSYSSRRSSYGPSYSSRWRDDFSDGEYNDYDQYYGGNDDSDEDFGGRYRRNRLYSNDYYDDDDDDDEDGEDFYGEDDDYNDYEDYGLHYRQRPSFYSGYGRRRQHEYYY